MAIATKEEETKRRILETKQQKSFTESYSPAIKELKHTPPVREYIKTLGEATSPFAAVLTKERIKINEKEMRELSDRSSNLKKAFPHEISLIKDAIVELDSRLETAKKTQKAEDYKLFYADFAKVSRAVNHLTEVAVKSEIFKGKALEAAKKALDITYSVSEFVVPPVMIAGRMTGAKEDKITKVDKAIIAVSFVPFAGTMVKTARLGKGAVLATKAVMAAEEAAQASRVAKESAFLAKMAARAKVTAVIGQKETSATDKFISLSKDVNIYLRDAKSSLKAFDRTNDMNKLDRARLSGQEAARRLNMAKEVVQRELELATKAKDVNAIGQAKHLLNEIAATEKSVNAFRAGADQTARMVYDVKSLSTLAKGAEVAKESYRSLPLLKVAKTADFSSSIVEIDMFFSEARMVRVLNLSKDQKTAYFIKNILNVVDPTKLTPAQNAIYNSFSTFKPGVTGIDVLLNKTVDAVKIAAKGKDPKMVYEEVHTFLSGFEGAASKAANAMGGSRLSPGMMTSADSINAMGESALKHLTNAAKLDYRKELKVQLIRGRKTYPVGDHFRHETMNAVLPLRSPPGVINELIASELGVRSRALVH